MKRLKKFALLLFTLLLVAAGAAMPFAVSWLQDERQTDPEVRPFDSFSLTLRQETDLGRTLKLVGGSNYYIKEAIESEDTCMTLTDVLAAGEELIVELSKFGLLDHTPFASPRIWPQTLCANDDSVSIPTWTLEWDMDIQEAASVLYVWMDDAVGKAFHIVLPSVRYPPNYIYNVSTEPIYACAENWRAFLENYYGTSVQIADETWYDYAAKFSLLFQLGQDEEQPLFQLDLYIYFADGFTTLSPYVSPIEVPPSNASIHDS